MLRKILTIEQKKTKGNNLDMDVTLKFGRGWVKFEHCKITTWQDELQDFIDEINLRLKKIQ